MAFALAAAAVAAVCYLNTLHNGFVSDDHQLIFEHPYVKSVGDWARIFTVGHYAGSGGYRPFTTLSFALNYSVGDSHPFGFHLTNLLLHALNCALVFLIAQRLLRSATSALAIALIFAVHPIHSEAVAWISGRAELLATSLLLVAWLCHFETRRSDASSCFQIGSLAAFFAALLAKENALVFPLLIVLSDLFEQRRRRATTNWIRQSVRFYLPQIAVIAAYFIFRGLLYRQPLLRSISQISFIDNPLAHVAFAPRVFTALKVQAQYVALLFWPARLSGDYSFNSVPVITSPFDAELWLSLTVILIIVAAGAYSYLRRGSVWFGIAFYAVTMIPTANLVTVIGSIKAERFLYLPSLGFCFAAVMGAGATLQWLSRRRLPYALSSAAVLLLALITAAAAQTWERNKVWRDEQTFWSSTARILPQNYKAQLVYGELALKAGEYEKGIEALEHARQIDPKSRDPMINLGAALLATGKPRQAIDLYRTALEQDPNCADCRINIALAHISVGDVNAGIRELRDVIVVQPENALAHFDLARVCSANGDTATAIDEYQRAAQLKPDYAEAWNGLGAVYLKMGRTSEARVALQRALQIRADFPEAIRNLALLDAPR